MKQLIFICMLLAGLAPSVFAEGEPPRPPKEEPKEAPKLSNGERIEIPDVGFSVTPPNGWMVNKNSHGSSLLFEAPKQANQIYQPTIQVMVFGKLRYIDEVTQKEYGDLIVEKFGKLSNRVTGYRLRSAEILQMETGDPAILYYTEFQYDDVPIMQMHILISSATNHFLMSYTDIAKVFEDESSPGLAIAYASMHSAQVSTQPPWRFRTPAMIGAVVFLMLVGWFTMRFMRSRKLSRLGQRIEDEDSKEISSDEESQYYSKHSPATNTESHAGDEEWSQPKSHARAAPKVSHVQSSHFDDDDDEAAVSDVVPISTLEKSLHPGRKRRQEHTKISQQRQVPDLQPQSLPPQSQPPMPVQRQQAQPQQQVYQQQPMPPQQVQPQPVSAQPMPPPHTYQQPLSAQQPVQPQQPYQQPVSAQQPVQPQQPYQQPVSAQQPVQQQQQYQQPVSAQQPVQPQQQYQQPVSAQPVPQQQQYQQPVSAQPVPQQQQYQQPVSAQQPVPQQQQYQQPVSAQQPIPQQEIYLQPPVQSQQSMQVQQPMEQQQVYQQPVSAHQPVPPPQAYQQPAVPPPISQQEHPSQYQQAVSELSAHPTTNPQQQWSQPVPQPQSAPQPVPAHVAMAHAAQLGQHQQSNPGFMPQAAAPQAAPGQAYAASPAPVGQTYAPPPQPHSTPMPQFVPPIETVTDEPPVTSSRISKSTAASRMKKPVLNDDDDEEEPEMTEEARLSEILPKAGTIEKSKPKRKGLFWRKKADDDDGDDGDASVEEVKSSKTKASKRSKGDDDDDQESGDQWAVEPTKKNAPGRAAVAEDHDDDEGHDADHEEEHEVAHEAGEAEESDTWAPEPTKRSEPKKDSLLDETQGPRRLASRAPEGPVTRENKVADADDGWNLSKDAGSQHDDEDEEEDAS